MHTTVRVDPVPVHMLDLLRSLEAAYLAAPAADLEEMARWIEEEALEVADLFRQSVTLHDILRLAFGRDLIAPERGVVRASMVQRRVDVAAGAAGAAA